MFYRVSELALRPDESNDKLLMKAAKELSVSPSSIEKLNIVFICNLDILATQICHKCRIGTCIIGSFERNKTAARGYQPQQKNNKYLIRY